MRRLLLPCLLLLGTLGRAQQQPAPKAVAYYCASGNTVKYHASPTCRGLNRCSATIKPLPLSEAQAKMQPCRVCH